MRPPASSPVRLFQRDWLEALTHVHPITPALMWGPVVAYLFYTAFARATLSAGEWILWVGLGLLTWTFTEYAVHRWAFHHSARTAWGKRLIYLFHGIHHDAPDEATRLVMPPLPALLIMGVLGPTFYALIPERALAIFGASFLVGYLCYDYIHYAIHHWPMKSKVGSYLRKHHLRHHHAKEHSKFGVSNPLWDYLLGTVTESKRNSRKFILCIRFLSLFFTVVCVVFLFDNIFEWYAYTLGYFIRAIISFSIYGAACNFGLFFITTQKAKKMKIFSTICYIPTILQTPIMVSYVLHTPWGVPIAFLGTIALYIHFNPWRNNE